MTTEKLLAVRVAEVTYDGRIDEYEVIAENNVVGRDCVVKHLGQDRSWKSIRVRDTPEKAAGPARVTRKL